MFAVCVTFEITPGEKSRFMPLMQHQATTSLQQEAGCHHFDICTDPDSDTIFLYELYTDPEAFQTHLKSAHYARFDTAVAPMVAAKNVKTFTSVFKG